VTSRSPEDLPAFCKATINVLKTSQSQKWRPTAFNLAFSEFR
jgi:hypothetical protein